MTDAQTAAVETWANENGVAPVAVLPDTPDKWFAGRFPSLPAKHGSAILEGFPSKEGEKPFVKDIGEDFLAGTLGELGRAEAPTVFMAAEDRFYSYRPESGIYGHEREAKLTAELSGLLLACARECAEKFDTQALQFKFRDTASLKGVMQRARGLLEVPYDFFECDLREYIACRNGMLRVSDGALLPFAASFRRRNKLAVDFVPGATCPMFLNVLMNPALEPEEIELIQRWCGLALIGVNLAQRIIILSGTPGGGKGTFIRVLQGIIGSENMATLRPKLLAERFEVGRFLGKSLLYGPDVEENFLSCEGASVLKSLTGGDPITVELKGSNERPVIVCRFNAIVTCNSRLKVHLEGDKEAWRRRLAIVEYHKAKPGAVIADLSEQIIAKEGSGVLNWMLEGLVKLRADGWNIHLTGGQQKLVDALLMESEADVVFAKECLRKEATGSLTVAKCYEAYVAYCNDCGWVCMAKKRFSNVIGDTVTREFGLTVRHDIADDTEKNQRGWKGLVCAR